MTAKFGPAGADQLFAAEGHKSSLEMCEWLSNMGLDAYEYQCNRGVKIKEEKARRLGETAREFGISLSIHSQYYINLATPDMDNREKSIQYILECLTAADWMGAARVVVHSGSPAKLERKVALQNAKETLMEAQRRADEIGLAHIHICPETMGKIGQLGDLDEVMELCSLDERFLPTIDFGHLHTRGLGCLNTIEDFAAVLNTIENRLGTERARMFHSHFSRMEFTKGGEKRHHTYADTQYGPDFEPLASLLFERKLSPTIICESAGTQARDAKTFKELYQKNFALGDS